MQDMGHALSQAPQLTHASLITYAKGNTSKTFCYHFTTTSIKCNPLFKKGSAASG
jgi:hypothetical protein